MLSRSSLPPPKLSRKPRIKYKVRILRWKWACYSIPMNKNAKNSSVLNLVISVFFPQVNFNILGKGCCKRFDNYHFWASVHWPTKLCGALLPILINFKEFPENIWDQNMVTQNIRFPLISLFKLHIWTIQGERKFDSILWIEWGIRFSSHSRDLFQ